MLLFALVANADNILYAVFYDADANETFETMTLKCCASDGDMPVGAVKYPGSTAAENKEWTASFRNDVTSVIVDASCLNYSGKTLSGLFSQLSNVTAITNLTNLCTDDVENMYYMFLDCSSLTTLDLSGFNTANVTWMYDMFGGCSAITLLDLSSFDTSKVTTMEAMFYKCSSLTSLDLTGFNTSSVTNMSEMFEGCSGLTSLNISSFNTANVTDMKFMFNGCRSLSRLNLTSFNTASVTSMGSMFNNCSALNAIFVGDGWNTDGVDNSYGMFSSCTSLVGEYGTAYINKVADEDKSRAFVGDGGYLSSSNAKTLYAVLSDADGNGVNETMTLQFLPYISMPDDCCRYDGTNSWNSSFCHDVLTCVIDESCQNYAGTTLSNLFYDCYRMTTINGMTNLRTADVTDMSYMFAYCNALSSIDMSAFNTANVTRMENMFMSCYNVQSLDFSSFNTGNVTNMSNMFSRCTQLSALDLSTFNTANVTDMSYMFYTCSNLSSINVSTFNTANVTDMSDMFAMTVCTSLDLSSFNTSNVRRMTQMFYHCTVLTTITVSSLWDKNGAIGNEVFTNCYRLVGEDGYAYDADYTDVSRAYVGEYGYLTGDKREYRIFARLTDTDYNGIYDTAVFDYDSDSRIPTGDGYEKYDGTVDWNTAFATGITELSLDAHLGKYAGTTLKGLFANFDNVTAIADLDKLNTTSTEDMSDMFNGCTAVTELDLRSFSTATATDMSRMFNGCTALHHIYVGSGWTTASVTASNAMFVDCTNIEGEDGTVLGAVTDKTCAHHDDGGYLLGDIEHYVLCMFFTDEDNDGKNETATLTYVGVDTESRLGAVRYDCGSFGWDYGAQKQYITCNVNPRCRFYAGTTLHGLFDGFENLTTINGLQHLRTNNVTDMGSMFSGCESLTSLNLSGFNSDIVTDMSYMFSECKALTSLNLSGFHTYCVSDMSYMFNGCESLASLDVSGFHTSSVTNMSHMFASCLAVESLDVSGFDTRDVTDMSAMFSACYKLSTLDLSNFETDNVTDMSYMFGSSGFTDLDVSSFYTYYVTTMEGMFSGCNLLTSLNLGYLNTRNVTNMSYMFSSTALSSIDLSSFYTEGVTTMSSMFQMCENLTSLDLSSFDTENVTDMQKMFYGCNALETIVIDEDYWNTTYLSNSTNMFSSCLSLVGEDGTTYNSDRTDATYAHNHSGGYLTGKRDNYVLYASYRDSDSDGNNDTMTLKYGHRDYLNVGEEECSYGFSLMTGIKTIDIDPSCRRYKGTTLSYLFSSFSDVTTINNLANLGTANVTDMSWMFAGCYKLTELDLSDLNTSNVTSMSCMFSSCYKLASLNLSGFNTANVTDMSSMFDYCEKLTSLDLSNLSTGNVTDMSCMFDYCTELKTIVVGDGWSTDAVEHSDCMFARCDNLVGEDGETHDYGYDDHKEYATTSAGGALTSNKLYNAENNTSKLERLNGMTLGSVVLDERTFYKDGSWNTLCLPFALTASEIADEDNPLYGATIKTLTPSESGFNAATGVLTLNFEDADAIEVGKPYIVKWGSPEAPEGSDLTNPVFTDVTINAASVNEKSLISSDDLVCFIGTFDPAVLTANTTSNLYLGAGNKLYYPTVSDFAVNAFRAYFTLESAASVKSFVLNFGDDESDITDTVHDVHVVDAGSADGAWYDLSGRRVTTRVRPGVYIRSGRKVLVN